MGRSVFSNNHLVMIALEEVCRLAGNRQLRRHRGAFKPDGVGADLTQAFGRQRRDDGTIDAARQKERDRYV
jgi:hypothetical protein